MGADREVGLVPLEELDEGDGVELLERNLEAVVPVGLIRDVVEPAEHLRHRVDHVDVGLGVEAAEEGVGEFQGVDVVNRLDGPRLDEGPLERLPRADMTRPRGRR